MQGDTRVRIIITKVLRPDELTRQIAPHMEKLGQAVGARMQRVVPKRTWALHDTISSETVTEGASVVTTVGFGSGDVGYGLLVERGTSKQAAQPFARPALLQSRAGDLNYKGKGVTRHGVVTLSTRRQRSRNRRTKGRG